MVKSTYAKVFKIKIGFPLRNPQSSVSVFPTNCPALLEIQMSFQKGWLRDCFRNNKARCLFIVPELENSAAARLGEAKPPSCERFRLAGFEEFV